VLIPPSIILVIYAVLTETSITNLFVAAVIPGLMQVVIYAATIALIVRIWPGSASQGRPTGFARSGPRCRRSPACSSSSR